MRSEKKVLPDSFKVSASASVKHSAEQAEGKCIMCGSSESMGAMCPKCLSKYPRDDLGQINILFMITTFSIAVSLMIIASSAILGGHYSGTMNRISWLGPVLLVLSVMGSAAIFYQGRRSLIRMEPLVYLAFIIGSLITIASASFLLNVKPEPSGITLSVIAIITGISITAGAAYGIRRISPNHIILPLLGFLPSFTGFTRIISGKPDIIDYWLLHNDMLMILGMVLTFIIIILSINASALWSKILMPTLLWSTGVLISAASLLVLHLFGSGPLIQMSIFTGILLVTIGMGSLISWRYLNFRMDRELSEVSSALIMAEEMYRSGKNYYALQHVDRALNLNPVCGMGKDRRTDNIIFKVDRGRSLRNIIFEPGEYELAYNEKGKILTSQGKYPEATKAYMEGIRRCPEYPESYINLAMLLYSTPGKRGEGAKYFNYYLTSKSVFMKRWLKGDLTESYVRWMIENYEQFNRALRLKGNVLGKLGAEGDLLGYYSMMKGG